MKLKKRDHYSLKKLFLLIVMYCAVSIGLTNVANAQSEKPSELISNSGNSPNLENSVPTKQVSSIENRVRNGELPLSRLYNDVKPEANKTIRFSKLNENEKLPIQEGKTLRIGTVRKIEKPNVKISDGSVFSFNEGGVWLIGIEAEEAVQVRLHFDGMNLPEGAKIFVYSAENLDDVYQYENQGQGENGKFWTPPIEGSNVIVEYFVPDASKLQQDELAFHITEISHIFLDPFSQNENCMYSPPSQPCHLNVPSAWADVAKSVGFLEFVKNGGNYICTGTLLNPVGGDFYPLLLTANHCFDSQASAQSLRVYWAYNSGDFPSSSLPRSDSATLLSTSSASDYTLVQILGALPVRANQFYWSGWTSATPAVGTAITGLHHPTGSYKRYSAGSVISGYCPYTPCQNYTGVRYTQGTTEGGSSGSGLWTGSGTGARLVGQLYGGETGCGIRDSFGKFSVTYSNISSFMQGGSDDSLDNGTGNDNRNNASTNFALTIPSGLIVKLQDEDWYRITVPNNMRLTVTANFTHVYGDLDMELYRGTESSPISVSTSDSNTESVTFDNSSGSAQSFDTRIFLYDGVRNTYGLRFLLENVGPTCPTTAISFGQIVSGNLAASDCLVNNRYADLYSFSGTSGQQISIAQNAAFDTYLYLLNSSGAVIVEDDDGGEGVNSRIPAETGFFTLPATGTYTIRATSFSFNATGAYTLVLNQNANLRTSFDFDGDGKADQTVFRSSNTIWYLLQSNSGFTARQFGIATDKIVPADFDGDGRTDIAVFRNGFWYWLNSSNGSFNAFQFGQAGDIPIPADFTGDGRAELAVYRAGIWYIWNLANNQFNAVQFGLPSDKVVPADFDGDGATDIAVYRNGVWYWLRSSDNGFRAVQFGIASDTPTVGDYDGDGRADQAVYRSGIWYILGSTQGFYGIQFGIATDIPTAADYDGDGKTDIGVYRNGNGTWYWLRSSNGQFSGVQFGITMDKPIPAAFVP